MNLQIAIDPLEGPQVAALLQAHLDEMHRISPPESVHALDLSRLRAADITFWSAYQGDTLLGCAALRALDAAHGEVKSMRTTPQARRRGYRRLSLETGSQPEFAPARALYARFGFVECGPFGDYRPDPCSTYMTRALAGAQDEASR